MTVEEEDKEEQSSGTELTRAGAGAAPKSTTNQEKAGGEQPKAGNERSKEPKIRLATFHQKVWFALVLCSGTAILLGLWFYTVGRVEKKSRVETTVKLNAPSDLFLRPGPPSFWYDKQSNKLYHRGPIDDKTKEQLMGLTNIGESGDDRQKEAARAYSEAIDQLAYQANKDSELFMLYILFLGGLSGVLGVQLRSIVNFIGVACFKNELDVSRYWPWYWTRPMVGFILGVVSVLVIEAQLLIHNEAARAGTAWWLAVAFLAGFGASEFTDRLRLLSQTLFGKGSVQSTPTGAQSSPGRNKVGPNSGYSDDQTGGG
jgi:hypothetical protein